MPKPRIIIPIYVDVETQLPYETWRILVKFLAGTKCEFCGTKWPLQCHHIDQNTENNCIANGLCLCIPCHAEWHQASRTHKIILTKILQENRLIQLRQMAKNKVFLE